MGYNRYAIMIHKAINTIRKAVGFSPLRASDTDVGTPAVNQHIGASRFNKISMIRPGLGVHIDDTFPRPPTFVLTSQNAVQYTSATTAMCTLRTYIQSVPMFRFVGPDITGVRLSKSLSASAHRAWRITIARLALAVGGQAQMTQRVVFPQARHAQVLFCSVLSRRPPSYSFPAYFILHTLVLSCPVLNRPVPMRPVLSRRAPVLSSPQC